MSYGTIITEDGEVLENVKFYTEEEQYNQKRHQEIMEITRNVKHTPKEHMFFKRFITEFNKITDLNPQTITRLMYLSTYVSYKDNLLTYDNGIPLKRKDIIKIMGLGEDSLRAFLKEVKEKGYLVETDEGYKISLKLIHKGETKLRPLDEHERYIKVYIQAMRKMYNSVSLRQHKFLGYVFQMLPYVNIYHNILCLNPFEENIDNIHPLSFSGMIKDLGLSIHNIDHFRKTAERVLFEINGEEQHFMCYVLNAEVDSKNDGVVVINPYILYGESEIKRVDAIGFFKKQDKEMKKYIDSIVEKEGAERKRLREERKRLKELEKTAKS